MAQHRTALVTVAVLLSLSTALPLGAAAAQSPTTVSPRRATNGLGDGSNRYPFGQADMEYQQVHSAWSFSNSTPITVTGIRLSPSLTTQPARVEFEMWMAESPHGADGASRTFAANEIAATRVRVLDRRFVTLPANSGAWGFHIPFDRPFVWNGGHVSWRVRMHGNDQGNTPLRYAFEADLSKNRSSRTGSFTGCASASGTRAATHDTVLRATGGSSQFYVASRVPNVALPGFVTFGLSATSLNGVPLPFDLDPIGATGCMITNDVVASATFTTQADQYGSAFFELDVPNLPGLPGQTLYTQAVFLQPGANPFGVFMSPGATNVVPGRNGVARNYGPRGATDGGVEQLFGLIVGFEGS